MLTRIKIGTLVQSFPTGKSYMRTRIMMLMVISQNFYISVSVSVSIFIVIKIQYRLEDTKERFLFTRYFSS